MLHPLKPKLSTKSAFLIFIIIWLIAFGSSTPSLFFYNVYFIDDFGYQCLPYIYQRHQQNTNSTTPSPATTSYDIHKVYIVYNIYSQYVIPFIIISCAYFRIGSHLYFSKPVGQTKYQEVITRNKRKVRVLTIFNQRVKITNLGNIKNSRCIYLIMLRQFLLDATNGIYSIKVD
jgi:hypothetical protein